MPTINKLPKKKKSTQHSDTERRKMRSEAYNTTFWRKLRMMHLKSHPLCEECLKNNGKVTPADSVHHIQSPFRGNKVNYDLFYDPNNLESICAECHAKVHAEERGYIDPKTILEELERLMDENISDEEFE
jgi:5-methylcytosine-specific restriction endonuclease McrA